MKVVLWLHDMRDPKSYAYKDLLDTFCPGREKVVWAKDAFAFKEEYLQVFEDPDSQLVGVFFDNDLGTPGGADGRHVFTWMERHVRENNIPEFELYAQTSNPAAKRELNGGFASLRRFWAGMED